MWSSDDVDRALKIVGLSVLIIVAGLFIASVVINVFLK